MFEYSETAEIHRLLDALEGQRGIFDIGATLPRRWAGRLRRDIEIEAVAASTAIEGVKVTADDVRHILVGDVPDHVTAEDAALVNGYRDAMSYVLRRADDPSFVWQSELLRAIHDRVLAGSFALGAGRYRAKDVYVVDRSTGSVKYAPPPPDEVPGLVDAALASVGEDRHPAPVVAALVHVMIAAIHPFADGNGRTARICASLALYRGGYRRPEFTSLEEWWGSHTSEYYDAFDALGPEWDPGADVTPFVSAHLAAHVAQIETYGIRLEAERDIWTALQNICTDIGDERMVDALYDASHGRSVTNRYYREIAEISSVTAATDLARLTAAGLLRSEGAGPSTRYVADIALMARLAAELGLEGEPEPGLPIAEQREWIAAQLRWRVRER